MASSGRTDIYASALDYAPSGLLTGMTYANGVDYVASANTRNLLASESYGLGGNLLSARTMTWDKNGNPDAITDSVSGSTCGGSNTIFCDGFDGNTVALGTDSRAYVYDTLDRLTKMTSSRYGVDQYTYDPLGNVRSRRGIVATTWHYDATHNRVSDENGSVIYTHDTRGNVTSIGGFALNWNRANELQSDALGTTYAYDARGWRVKMDTPTEGGYTRYDVYDGGCPRFCVNGPQAGNCQLTWRHNDYDQA